ADPVADAYGRERAARRGERGVRRAPTHERPVDSDRAAPGSGGDRDERAGRWRSAQRVPPTRDAVVTANRARFVDARGHHAEGASRRRRLAGYVVPPTRERAVVAHGAAVAKAEAQLRERAGRRRVTSVRVEPPTLDGAARPYTARHLIASRDRRESPVRNVE